MSLNLQCYADDRAEMVMLLGFLFAAKHRSPSPGKKVGAVIYHPKTKTVATGYNAFASGIPNNPSIWHREDNPLYSGVLVRQHVVVHAEVNALKAAYAAGMPIDECELYCTLLPCVDCFRDVVLNSGIKRVYYLDTNSALLTVNVIDAICELANSAGITLCKLIQLDTTR